jgi:hypothetical protein
MAADAIAPGPSNGGVARHSVMREARRSGVSAMPIAVAAGLEAAPESPGLSAQAHSGSVTRTANTRNFIIFSPVALRLATLPALHIFFQSALFRTGRRPLRKS